MQHTAILILLAAQSYFAAASNYQDELMPVGNSKHDTQDYTEIASKEQNRNKWYFAYCDEYKGEYYEPKMVDGRFDARVANVLYTKNKVNILSFDMYQFKYDDPGIRREYESFIGGPEVDETSCRSHLRQMNALLDELAQINRYHRLAGSDKCNSSAMQLEARHVLMARVLDSYGRYESGVLTGRANLIGSPDQCLETRLVLGSDSDEEVVGTRYCKAALGFNSELDPRVQDDTHVYLDVGICLPNTCHSSSLKDNRHLIQRLVDSQFSMPESIYLRKHRKTDHLFCLNDGNTSTGLPLGGQLFVTAALMWVILLIGATCYARRKRVSRHRAVRIIVGSLDMRESIRDFIDEDTKRAASPVDLDALNIVKSASMLLIVFGHCAQMVANFDPNGLRLASSFRHDHTMAVLVLINQMVDTFFVMSGLLFSYIALKKLGPHIESSRTLSQISRLAVMLFLGRYLRLVPLFALVFWFKKSVLLYMGSGPLWDHGFNVDTSYGACKQQSWLTPWTYSPAMLPMDRHCLPQTWSLGSEIFFILVTTPTFLLLAKRPRPTMLLASALSLASCMMMYQATLEADSSDLESVNSFQYDLLHVMIVKFSVLYTNPSYRLLPVMGGLVGGYFLHRYEKDTRRRWPNWFARYATWAAVGGMSTVVLSFLMIPTLLKYELQKVSMVEGLLVHTSLIYRFIWALASCVLLLRLASDCRGALAVQLFAGRLGRMMSKISLAVLLIHFDVLFVKHVTNRNLNKPFTLIGCFDVFLVSCVYTISMAVMVHVLVENPINKLIKSTLLNAKGHPIKQKQI